MQYVRVPLLLFLVLWLLLAALSGASSTSEAKNARSETASNLLNLGVQYHNGHGYAQDYARAKALYEKAAELNHPRAYAYLASLYQDGKGTALDLSKAVELYTLAAKMGDRFALEQLAFMYRDGNGVARDVRQAVKMFEQAGSARSFTAIGAIYEIGDGVTNNYAKAFDFYKKGAEAGCDIGQRNLARMYYLGRSVSKDYVRAYAWYSVAKKQDPKVSFAFLEEEMSSSEIIDAQKLAEKIAFSIDNRYSKNKWHRFVAFAYSVKWVNVGAFVALFGIGYFLLLKSEAARKALLVQRVSKLFVDSENSWLWRGSTTGRPFVLSFSFCIIIGNAILFAIIYKSGGGFFEAATLTVYEKYGALTLESLYGSSMFSLVSSVFVHFGFFHLVFNSIWIYVFFQVEDSVGSAVYSLVYLATGAFAGLVSVLYYEDARLIAGASGAVFGIAGCSLGLVVYSFLYYCESYKKHQGVAFEEVLDSFINRYAGALVSGIIFIGYTLLGIIMPSRYSSAINGSTAHVAHFAGLVFGVMLGICLGKPLSRNSEDILHLAKRN